MELKVGSLIVFLSTPNRVYQYVTDPRSTILKNIPGKFHENLTPFSFFWLDFMLSL